MKIIVPIKQVPYVDQLKFDRRTNRLIREGVESEINPFDKRALTQAILLKPQLDAQVVVITMGPPAAAQVLRELPSGGNVMPRILVVLRAGITVLLLLLPFTARAADHPTLEVVVLDDEGKPTESATDLFARPGPAGIAP